MIGFADISEMLLKAGPELDVEEIAAVEETESWLVALDDETEQTVSLTLDTTLGKLFLSTEIGQPPEERLADTLDHALAFNLASVETGGLRIGREAELGEFVLLGDLSTANLDAEVLAQMLSAFAEASTALGNIFAAGIGDETPPPAETAGETSHHIRV
ncbi:MAG: type III secretion system chaperone [Pseudomonadota bacterium]